MTLTLGAMAAVFGAAGEDAAGNPADGRRRPRALLAANLYRLLLAGRPGGPVTWCLLGEMFENRIRALALSIAAAAQWVANFLVSATFPRSRRPAWASPTGSLHRPAAPSLVFVVALHPRDEGQGARGDVM